MKHTQHEEKIKSKTLLERVTILEQENATLRSRVAVLESKVSSIVAKF